MLHDCEGACSGLSLAAHGHYTCVQYLMQLRSRRVVAGRTTGNVTEKRSPDDANPLHRDDYGGWLPIGDRQQGNGAVWLAAVLV